MKKKITGWIAALLLLLTCTAYADSTIPSSVAAYNGKRNGGSGWLFKLSDTRFC